jgi:hypothetical protein
MTTSEIGDENDARKADPGAQLKHVPRASVRIRRHGAAGLRKTGTPGRAKRVEPNEERTDANSRFDDDGCDADRDADARFARGFDE